MLQVQVLDCHRRIRSDFVLACLNIGRVWSCVNTDQILLLRFLLLFLLQDKVPQLRTDDGWGPGFGGP